MSNGGTKAAIYYRVVRRSTVRHGHHSGGYLYPAQQRYANIPNIQ